MDEDLCLYKYFGTRGLSAPAHMAINGKNL